MTCDGMRVRSSVRKDSVEYEDGSKPSEPPSSAEEKCRADSCEWDDWFVGTAVRGLFDGCP